MLMLLIIIIKSSLPIACALSASLS